VPDRKSLLVSVVLVWLLFGCYSPVGIKRTAVSADYQFPYTSHNAGLTVSADPYIEEERLHKHFGANLVSQMILPVLFKVENRNADDPYVVKKAKTSIIVDRDMERQPTIDKAVLTERLERAERDLKTFNSIMGVPAALFPVLVVPTLAVSTSLSKTVDDDHPYKHAYKRTQSQNDLSWPVLLGFSLFST